MSDSKTTQQQVGEAIAEVGILWLAFGWLDPLRDLYFTNAEKKADSRNHIDGKDLLVWIVLVSVTALVVMAIGISIRKSAKE